MPDTGPSPNAPIDRARATDIASRFLTCFWNDTAAPDPALTKDVFGAPVWRITTPRQNRNDGLHGLLTIDIDARSGDISGVRFKPSAR